MPWHSRAADAAVAMAAGDVSFAYIPLSLPSTPYVTLINWLLMSSAD